MISKDGLGVTAPIIRGLSSRSQFPLQLVSTVVSLVAEEEKGDIDLSHGPVIVSQRQVT
jgi:hypothetical protein